MAANFIQLNDDNTELVLIGNPNCLSKIRDFELSISNVRVKPSSCARNLGVYFDCTLSFKSFIQKTAATATFRTHSFAALILSLLQGSPTYETYKSSVLAFGY